MNNREFDQIKSYSTVIVAELHKIIFEDTMFSRLKQVLRLAEEMECAIFQVERKQKEAVSNVFLLKKIS
jgi:hypothetical protein